MTIHDINISNAILNIFNGRTMFYLTSNNEMRSAVCSESYFDDRLGRFIHVGTSTNGHTVRLTDS